MREGAVTAPQLGRRFERISGHLILDEQHDSWDEFETQLMEMEAKAEERAIATIDGSRLLDQAYHDALLLRDRDTPIVFQCHHGIRSQLAAEYFRRQGFSNLYNLSGGIDAWSALVDPSVPRY